MELLGTTDAAAAARGEERKGGKKGRNVPRSDAKLARSLALSEAARRPRVSTVVVVDEASFFLLMGTRRGERERESGGSVSPRSSFIGERERERENECLPRYHALSRKGDPYAAPPAPPRTIDRKSEI